MQSENSTAGHDNLALWLALEIRRSRAAFDKSRKEQDAYFEARGLRKSGPRVKATLKSASEICVALADATIAKAGELRSTSGQISEAKNAVLGFTREIANSAIPLAFFVSGETGLGGSVVKAATQIATQLYHDIEGAFVLAKDTSIHPTMSAPKVFVTDAPEPPSYRVKGTGGFHPSTSPKVNVATIKKSAGRPKGAGAIDDSPHLAAMTQLIAQNPAISVRAAARALEPNAAQPSVDPESTIRRLKLKYEAIAVGGSGSV